MKAMPEAHHAEITIVRIARVLTYLVYAFVVIALVILLLGFFLLLFGANPDVPFAEFVYRSLDRVMAPFRGLFKAVELNGTAVLDPSILFAMIIYGIAGIALNALIEWLSTRLMRLRYEARLAESQAPAPDDSRTPVAV
jgi:uncharacterized protein YggT (Ycf19 family)